MSCSLRLLSWSLGLIVMVDAIITLSVNKLSNTIDNIHYHTVTYHTLAAISQSYLHQFSAMEQGSKVMQRD